MMDTLQLKLLISSSLGEYDWLKDSDEAMTFAQSMFEWVMQEAKIEEKDEGSQLVLAFDKETKPVN